MAEKEERISVIVYEKDPCENCPGNPMTDCQVCEKDLRYDGGMTRQEAIDRIAKALCKNEGGGGIGCKRCVFAKDKEKCEEWVAFNHIRDAKIALDALLSLHG